MATQEELNQQILEAINALNQFNKATQEARVASEEQVQASKMETKAKEKAAKEEAKRQEMLNAKLNLAQSVLGGAVSALGSYTKAVYKGELGAKAFSGAADDLSNAAKQAAVALAILVPGGPLIKGITLALGFLVSKLIDAGKEVNEQTGKIYDAFSELGKLGANAGGGMQDVFNGLQKMGLGLEQFPEVSKMLGENAEQLSGFAGTMADGRHSLENMIQGMRGFRTDLQMLGIDRSKLVEVGAQYLRVQGNLTRQTKENMDTSDAAVMKYVKETDMLTRITGMSRKKQEEAMEKAMSEEVFGSFIDEMTDQGNQAAAKNLNTFNQLITSKIGPQFAQGFRDSMISPGSDAAQAFLRAAGAGGQEIIEQLRTSGKELNPKELGALMNKLAGEIDSTNKSLRPLRTVGGDVAKTFGPNSEARNAAKVLGQDLEKVGAVAMAQQDQDIKGDEATRKMAEMINAQQDEQLALQKTLNLGMNESINVMHTTAVANKKLAEAALAAAVALGKLASGGGGNVDVGGAGAADVGAEGAAITGAAASGPTGVRGPGAPTTGAGGVLTGVTGALTRGLQAMGLRGTDYYLKGPKEGLDERLLQAMGLAAKEYGQPITINSGYRSPEEQKELYDRWIKAGGGPDKPTAGGITTPAPPGKSRHQSGLALDIDKRIADELDQQGLLAKYGLARPVPGDPVHIQLEKFEFGGSLGAGKMGIAGEAGAELISGPADITPMNDLMRELGSLNEVSGAMLATLRDIARRQAETADTSRQLLQVAQN